MLAARPYDSSDEQEWDELVRRARAPHFLFLRGYMEYHADRFVDRSLLVHDGSRLVAALPATAEAETVVSHGGLTFGGLVTDRSMTVSRTLEAFEAVCAHFRAAGIRTLVYKPMPHIYHEVPAEEDLYALFRHGARLVRRDLSAAIPMSRRPPYAKGRKWSVKRSRETQLHVVRGSGFREFIDVQASALERHGATPTHSRDELQLLAERFPENIKLYEGRSDGELVAGVVVYETVRVAHTQYIATTERGRELGAVDRVVDHLLAEVYRDVPWFDFGISTLDGGRSINVGLARQKESFGARAIAYDWYELELR